MKRSGNISNAGNVGLLFVIPAVAYMIVFVGYPIAGNIWLSLQDVTVRTINSPEKPFVGLSNYRDLATDPVLWRSVGNTFLFTLGSILFQFVTGFALALFLNGDFTAAKPVRGLMMISWMIPVTISGLIFKFIFTSNVGIVNEGMKLLGMNPIGWLLEPSTALFSLIVANIWIGIPFNMILLSTGLTVIPTELYESSSIDGAGKLGTFLNVTLPLLKPAVESILVLGFIYTFKVFDLVFVMTGGGPIDATQMMSTYSYKLSFSLFRYSSGATAANILFLILAAVGLFYLRFVYTDEEAS